MGKKSLSPLNVKKKVDYGKSTVPAPSWERENCVLREIKEKDNSARKETYAGGGKK